MTIKEAFEALSDACAKGMKNPFFVMRRLKESFDDVADKVVDTGGSVVEVEAELTEGTKVATITVDGDGTDIYVPDSSVNYSTTEKVIGKWIDGSDLYEITLEITPTSQINTMVSYPHNISNIDKILGFNAYLVAATGSCVLVPAVRLNEGTISVNTALSSDITITTTAVQLMFGYDRSYAKVYVTLRYTKSAT